MPELTITLDEERFGRLQEQAKRRQLTPEQLVQELVDNQLPLPAPVRPERPWQIVAAGLVALLESPEPETRRRGREQLSAFGPSMIPELEKLVPTASPTVLVEVATLLASSGSPAAIRSLLEAYARGDASNRVALYHEVRVLLDRDTHLPEAAWTAIQQCTPRTAPLVARQLKEFLGIFLDLRDTLDTTQELSAADILSLVALLRWRKTGTTAQRIAYALTSTALSAPVPELRQALPLLRPAWHNIFASAEFVQAVKAIENATAAWADLPLPAESRDSSEGQGLPVPTAESHAR